MQPIVQDEVVRHPDPVRLHGVASPIVIASKLRVIEVGNLMMTAIYLLQRGCYDSVAGQMLVP